MQKESIIIIGGGVAGLLAAKELATECHVTLLEANNRFGGRIYTISQEGFSTPIEGGAEFIHGTALHTFALLKEAGLTYTPVDGKFYRFTNAALEEQHEMVEGWDLLMDRMADIKEDIALQQFLLQHFSADKYIELRKEVKVYAEGFDLANPDLVSAKTLFREWSHETEDYRIDGGYGLLINYLIEKCEALGCRLVKNAAVDSVNWREGSVKVHTADDSSFEADKCLLTLPLGVLKQSEGNTVINFSPAIDPQLQAIDQIGFGSVIKVALQFDQPFWREDAAFFFSEETIPTWWTQLPAKDALLTGWVGGSQAKALSNDSDQQFVEKSLDSLAAIFDHSPEELKQKLKASKVFNWQNVGYVRGGYSFATPQTEAALQVLNSPLNQTLYFAGEGLYDGEHPGTVEAAISSAKKAVALILQ